jgi:tRNA A37 methylthiotransferase MiaB
LDIKDGVLIGSCVVTDRAKTKFVKEIKKYIKEGNRVYLTGCGVFENGSLMKRDKFFSLYPSLKQFSDKIVLLPEDTSIGLDKVLKNQIYTKYFLIIQNGCDNFCSFCLTVKKR